MPQPASVKKRLLCEGWIEPGIEEAAGSVYLPALRYCRQGDRLWIADGHDLIPESTSLQEAQQNDGITIVESIDDLELVERQLPNGSTTRLPKDGVWTVEGVAQRSDVKNANKRTYGRKIWERIIADEKSPAQETIKARGMIGHLEHPRDGRTDGKEGALVVTEARLLENGVVWGKFELLDTPNGLILQEYTRKNVRWGVSSRGNGNVDETGKVLDESYVLETWDAVMRPSTPGAYPGLTGPDGKKIKESVEGDGDTPPAPAQPSEKVLAHIAECEAMRDLDVEALDESEVAAKVKECAKLLCQTVDIAATENLKVEKANELAGWLNDKVTSIASGGGMGLSEAIDRALTEIDNEETDARSAAAEKVIESLRSQVTNISQESDALRVSLEEAEARIAALTQERDEKQDRLAEAEEEAAQLQRKLDLANGLLAERSEATATAKEEITEAVDEAISKVPVLESHRATLLNADSAEDVENLAESLLPMVVKATPQPETPTAPRRLPVGNVVSESIKPPTSKPALTESHGASVAAAAIKTRQ